MTYNRRSEGWTCPCFCCCCAGVPVRMHWTFLFVWVLQLVIAMIQYRFDYWKYLVNIAVLWGPLLAVICVIHEWGHIARTRAFGGTCHYMVIWPLGGFSDTNIENGTCLQEFWVALCGPLAQLPLFLIFVIVMALCAPNGLDYYNSGLNVRAIQDGGAGIFFAQLCKGAIDVNMMLFFLNLLVPAYPLDAARMLAAMSVHCGLSVVRAAWMLVIVGGLLGLACLIFGIIGLITGHNLGLFMLFLGLFMAWTTWSMYRSISNKQIFQHPVFSPDCYHVDGVERSRAQTNLSAPPAQRQMQRPSGSTTKSKKQPRKKSQGDIETGSPLKSKTKKKPPAKQSMTKKKPPKKKSPGS